MESGTLLQVRVLSIWETLAKAEKYSVQIFSTHDPRGISKRIYIFRINGVCFTYVR